jgi:hypothetical protein
MANIDTVKSISDNLQTVLEAQGIKFSRKSFEDDDQIPASLLPYGEIYYTGEEFEITHSQRPGYADIIYNLRVVLGERNPIDVMRHQQEWVHKLRDALTVNALNVGDLASSKLVALVDTATVSVENEAVRSALNYQVRVRYREL